MDIAANLGRRIREVRDGQLLSLRALAERSGVSSSMLSEIERGTKSPTIALVAAIAEGLKLPLSALLADGSTGQVTRAQEQRAVYDPTGVERISLGAHCDDSTVEFVRFKLAPHTTSGPFTAHRARTLERIHMERGRLEVYFGEQHVTLHRGDTLTYEATVRHSFANLCDRIAVLYLVIERR